MAVDEQGDEIIHRVEETRETVAHVAKRNGAYLINLIGPETDDSTPDELFDAASSLAKAKRLARAGAAGFNNRGPWRWIEQSWGWELEATHTNEWDQYADTILEGEAV